MWRIGPIMITCKIMMQRRYMKYVLIFELFRSKILHTHTNSGVCRIFPGYSRASRAVRLKHGKYRAQEATIQNQNKL